MIIKTANINQFKSMMRTILQDKSNNFVKKLVTIIVTAHFIIASFLILTLFPILFFIVTRGNIEMIKLCSKMFLDILEKDFWIIVAGFGFMSSKDWAVAMIEKAKAVAQGLPDNLTVGEGGSVTNAPTTAETVQTDKVDTVNTQTTNVAAGAKTKTVIKKSKLSNEVE